MSTPNSSVIRLEDYQPTDFATLTTQLAVDIHDGETFVDCRQQLVRRDAATAEPVGLVLAGQALTLLEVAVDGRVLAGNEYQVDAESLTIFTIPNQCELRVRTRIVPEENTALEGLYKSGSMYCTQCEAEGFRKITYYQDRPDVLSVFTTEVTADAEQYPVLLANGNCTADETKAGRRTVTWHDPHPKPSYLFALVAGDLSLLEDEFVTASGRKVTLHIYSEPHNIDQCGYAMHALQRSMRWDEEVYGREYDLDIFMIVAVDDFNMGAMENKGLNIFNTSCVLATPDTATDLAYQRVEAVVAHEYFHNWSGNRVTCRDWFQLSLKEGFTVFRDSQFSSDMHSPAAKRIADVSQLRAVQFAEDSSPLAHAVRPRSYLEISNFYTPTIYEKGAEVVRMLHTCLGADTFRAGSDLYFDRHDGSAATTEDFVQAMEAASSQDFSRFRQWYEQAGTPELTVASTWQDSTFALTVAQQTPATPGQPDKGPTHIPIVMALLAADGSPLALDGLQIDCDNSARLELRHGELVLHLLQAQSQLSIKGLTAEPQVSFLRGFSAPVRVRWDRSPSSLRFLAEYDTDGFARWDVLQSLLVAEVVRLGDNLNVNNAAVALDSDLLALVDSLIGQALAAQRGAESLGIMAEMLTLPGELYLFEQVDKIDVEALCGGRQYLQQQLGERLNASWIALYEANRSTQAYEPTSLAMAARRLQNLALSYLCASGRDETDRLLAHYEQADNLTDRRAALVEIANAPWLDARKRSSLLEAFYERWQDQALVVNQWLGIMASNHLATAADLAALEAHPSYDQRNPNKVRSLLGGFSQANQRNFHAADGSGYAYLAGKIVELNASNPQIAARCAQPLTRWRRYTDARGARMRAALETIALAPDLSKDVYEIVSKGLSS